MAKCSGGTRNYSNKTKTLAKRRSKLDKINSAGDYKISLYQQHAKGEEKGILKEIIVVGMYGDVHRHKL